MPSRMIGLSGSLPRIKREDASRLGVYIMRGTKVLAHGNVREDGSFRLGLSREAIGAPSRYALEAVVGPAGMAAHLEGVPQLQRVRLDRAQLEKTEREYRIGTEKIALTETVLKAWWLFCRWYCVNGTVVGQNGCPVPGAQVTVYTVGFGVYGFTKTARATVNADANGSFTACFAWCSCFLCWPCWPCWPLWWLCWPWWWEWDLLHVIEAIERIPPVGPGPVEGLQSGLALMRPVAKDLVRGQGFSSTRRLEAKFGPDPARTALVQRKLSNARIRAIFPWWWWCCDDPNIVFGVTQGPNTIVDENPATDTRWCLPDGSSVTLVGNQQAISVCPPDPTPETGFAWTRVGLITVDTIHDGYADGVAGTDTSDLAFAGTLDIYGEFAGGSGVSYYQVDAGQWTGNPARGGTTPGSSAPISADLFNHVFIYDGATLTFAGGIKMGPFSHDGLSNLYATQEARPTAPTGTGLDPFPPIPAGGTVIWAYNGRKVSTGSSALIGGGSLGAVDLAIGGYDAAFAAVALTPDDPLTLQVDNVGLTLANVNHVTAYRADNSLATLVGTEFCPAYDIGPGGYVTVDVTVTDANGHLWEYRVDAEYGHGQTDTITPPGTRGYSQAAMTFPPSPPYQPPDPAQKSFGGGTEVMTYTPPLDCCYEFRIRAGKRVTNGYSFPSLSDYDFQTVSLKVTP